jgi:lipoate-protein ligase A
VLGGRKIVGSAQHRDAHAFLQHGSILLADDQPILNELATVPLPEMPSPATLWSVRPDVSAEQLMDALTESVRAAADRDIVVTRHTDLLSHRVEALATRYRDPLWTWRR